MEGRMRRDIFVSAVVPLDNDLDILPAVVREFDVVMRRRSTRTRRSARHDLPEANAPDASDGGRSFGIEQQTERI
jgi:hypothetical protein